MTDQGGCHCDMPVTDARKPTHCHLCGRKKRLPSSFIPDTPTDLYWALQRLEEQRARAEEAERQLVSLQERNEEWRKANQDASNWRHCETERADKAERQLAKMRKDRDEQWQAKIRERERIVSFVARIKDLESQVAELELTGDRVELQSLLDSCGLDFERMRERALTAERQLAYARKEIECLKRLCEELRLERDKARE